MELTRDFIQRTVDTIGRNITRSGLMYINQEFVDTIGEAAAKKFVANEDGETGKGPGCGAGTEAAAEYLNRLAGSLKDNPRFRVISTFDTDPTWQARLAKVGIKADGAFGKILGTALGIVREHKRIVDTLDEYRQYDVTVAGHYQTGSHVDAKLGQYPTDTFRPMEPREQEPSLNRIDGQYGKRGPTLPELVSQLIKQSFGGEAIPADEIAAGIQIRRSFAAATVQAMKATNGAHARSTLENA